MWLGPPVTREDDGGGGAMAIRQRRCGVHISTLHDRTCTDAEGIARVAGLPGNMLLSHLQSSWAAGPCFSLTAPHASACFPLVLPVIFLPVSIL